MIFRDKWCQREEEKVEIFWVTFYLKIKVRLFYMGECSSYLFLLFDHIEILLCFIHGFCSSLLFLFICFTLIVFFFFFGIWWHIYYLIFKEKLMDIMLIKKRWEKAVMHWDIIYTYLFMCIMHLELCMSLHACKNKIIAFKHLN